MIALALRNFNLKFQLWSLGHENASLRVIRLNSKNRLLAPYNLLVLIDSWSTDACASLWKNGYSFFFFCLGFFCFKMYVLATTNLVAIKYILPMS